MQCDYLWCVLHAHNDWHTVWCSSRWWYMVQHGEIWSSVVWCVSLLYKYLRCGTVLHTMTGRGVGVVACKDILLYYTVCISLYTCCMASVVVACEDVNIIASFTLCFLLSASLHTWHPLKSNGFKWNVMDLNGYNIDMDSISTIFYEMWPFGHIQWIYDRPKTNKDPSDILC